MSTLNESHGVSMMDLMLRSTLFSARQALAAWNAPWKVRGFRKDGM